MALTSEQRRELFARFMRENTEPISVMKTEGAAFVDAIDAALDDAKVAFNSAIPQPARSSLTPTQKALGFKLLIEVQFLEGVF